MSFKLVDTDMLNWLDSKLRKYAKWRKWRGLPEPVSPKLDEITREALAILFSNANLAFESINREYDEAATIKIRKPKRYVSER